LKKSISLGPFRKRKTGEIPKEGGKSRSQWEQRNEGKKVGNEDQKVSKSKKGGKIKKGPFTKQRAQLRRGKKGFGSSGFWNWEKEAGDLNKTVHDGQRVKKKKPREALT